MNSFRSCFFLLCGGRERGTKEIRTYKYLRFPGRCFQGVGGGGGFLSFWLLGYVEGTHGVSFFFLVSMISAWFSKKGWIFCRVSGVLGHLLNSQYHSINNTSHLISLEAQP